MATLISRGEDIGFTILPYTFDTAVQKELLDHPSDYALGYITYDKNTGERKFTYTESGKLMESDHWSLAILSQFPYCEKDGPWILYTCSPEKTASEFGKILKMTHESLHIYNWDIWSVQGKDAKVAVVTSWEIF
jgi:hypothetical protein